ncbi:hypothetical protein HEK131_03690 [Streptomyces seoulensis]|nr:hypothetical protein HEK131_03690 [Streptomyces seoulensis]
MDVTSRVTVPDRLRPAFELAVFAAPPLMPCLAVPAAVTPAARIRTGTWGRAWPVSAECVTEAGAAAVPRRKRMVHVERAS